MFEGHLVIIIPFIISREAIDDRRAIYDYIEKYSPRSPPELYPSLKRQPEIAINKAAQREAPR